MLLIELVVVCPIYKCIFQQVVQRVNGFHVKRYICPESSSEHNHPQSPEDPMVCALHIMNVREVTKGRLPVVHM